VARGRSSFKMGTVELIVLFLLEKSDLYGYQLTTLIETLSDGKVVITESSLYPTLYKLKNNNFITDIEVPIGKRRVRVYYHLEEAGRKRLADLLEDYETNRIGTDLILACKKLPEEYYAAD